MGHAKAFPPLTGGVGGILINEWGVATSCFFGERAKLHHGGF